MDICDRCQKVLWVYLIEVSKGAMGISDRASLAAGSLTMDIDHYLIEGPNLEHARQIEQSTSSEVNEVSQGRACVHSCICQCPYFWHALC